jgi:hypothetical protein
MNIDDHSVKEDGSINTNYYINLQSSPKRSPRTSRDRINSLTEKVRDVYECLKRRSCSRGKTNEAEDEEEKKKE